MSADAAPNPCAPVPPSRLEWAGFAWGEPLTDYAVDPGPYSREDARVLHQRHGVQNGHSVRIARLPYDRVPHPDALWQWAHYAEFADAGFSGAHAVLEHLVTHGPAATAREFALPEAGHVIALRAAVLPHLAPDEVARWRAAAEAATEAGSVRRLLALAVLAPPDEFAASLAAAPDDLLRGHTHLTAAALLAALPDAEARVREIARLGVADLDSDGGDPAVAQVLGAAAAPGIVEWVLRSDDGSGSAHYFVGLTAIRDEAASAPAVTQVLRLARGSAVVDLARDWLAARPVALASYEGFEASDAQLLEAVLTRVRARDAGLLTEAADPVLADVIGRRAAAQAAPQAVPDWWRPAVAADKKAPKPTGRGGLSVPRDVPWFARAEALPPLLDAGGARLPADLAAELVAAAARGAKDPTLRHGPLVAAARRHLEPGSRDRLAIGLFDGYLASGADAKLRAYALAGGLLGGPGFADHVAAVLLNWPSRAAWQRSVLALDALAATGDRHATQLLSERFAKVKTRKVREGAQAALAKAAVVMGMTPDAYADTLVPDAGLDARAGLDLSFGARRFRAVLLPDGSTPVRELAAGGSPLPGAAGKPKKSLPAPRAGDDPDAAASAKAALAATRKALRTIAAGQLRRLERALVARRAWTPEQLRGYLAHPVLGGLARPLVWITDDGQSFRVTEEGEPVDPADDPVVLPQDATIRLAHPLLLVPEAAAAWRTALREHDLIAPFDQLDRAVAELPADAAGPELPARLLPAGVHPGTFTSAVEKAGWQVGASGPGGYRDTWTLAHPDVTLTLRAEPGVHPMSIGDGEPVAVHSIVASGPDGPVAWPAVDPVLASEVLTLLARLRPA